jgi:hypothetical protein
MRQHILDQLASLDLGTFRVSSELPWSAAGTPLYLKNPKVLYVDEPDLTQTTLFNTLCGGAIGLANQESETSVYVLCDAKQQPSNYDQLVESVKSIVMTFTSVRSREVDVVTSFEADQLLTEFVFRTTETVLT